MKRIDRYLIRTVAVPWVYGLLIFSTLWLVQILMKMIDLFVTKDVALWSVTRIFAYSLPQVYTTAAPMASLLAVLVGISRLCADSEVIALKACGVSFHRLMVPVGALGVLASLSVLGVGEWVVPEASRLRTQLYLNDVILKKPLPKIAQNLFFEGGKEFKMFVRSYEYRKNTIHQVTVFQLQPGTYPRITEAASANLSENRWVFRKGRTANTADDGHIENVIHFDTWDYPLDLRYGENMNEPKPRPADMALPDLYVEIRELESKGYPVQEHWIEFWWKTAFPFASLVMVLLGAPLAVTSGRSGASLGVGLSILIMFAYYVLLAMGKAAGESGHLTPFWASWSPNVLIAAVAWFLFHRASR